MIRQIISLLALFIILGAGACFIMEFFSEDRETPHNETEHDYPHMSPMAKHILGRECNIWLLSSMKL